MAQGWSVLIETCRQSLWISQMLQTPGMNEAQAAAFPLSGMQIIVTVLAGLLMAFAFQLLLANFGLAVGITMLSFRSKSPPDSSKADEDEIDPKQAAANSGNVGPVIGWATGFGILLTVNLVLLAACFLAVKLSWAQEPLLGAILGILIWSAYLLFLTGLSSAAVGSVVGQILGSATSGMRQLIRAVRMAFDRAPASESLTPQDLNQTIRQEVDAAFASLDLQSELRTYFQRLQPSVQTPADLRSRFTQLLSDPAQDVSAWAVLDQIDRQTLLDWMQHQTNWPEAKAAQVVDALEAAWQQVRDRHAQEAQPDAIATVLDTLKSAASTRSPASASGVLSNGAHSIAQALKTQDLMAPLRQVDAKRLMRSALNRVDWSDWDIETLWHRLQALQPSAEATHGEKNGSDRPFSVLRLDVEDYLLSAYVWNLNPERLAVEFREVLHDPEADPQQVYEQVQTLRPSDWPEPLRQRGDLDEQQVEQITNWLEDVRQEVLHEVQNAMDSDEAPSEDSEADPDKEAVAPLQASLESYLRYTNLNKLTDENIQQKVQALTEDWLQADQAFPDLDFEALETILKRRRKLNSKRRHQMMKQLQTGWADLNRSHPSQDADSEDADSPSMPQRLKAIATHSLQRVSSSVKQAVRRPKRWRLRRSLPDLQTQLRHYLRHQQKSALTPEAIQHDVERLLKDAQTQLASLGKGLADQADETAQQWAHVLPDWHGADLMEVLAERQDMTRQEAEAIAHQIQTLGQRLGDRTQEMQQQAHSGLKHLWHTIHHQLDAIERPDVEPEQVQHDLADILNRPRLGLVALKTSLSRLLKERSLPLDLLPLEALQDKLTQLSQEALSTVSDLPGHMADSVVSHLKEQLETLQEQLLQQAEQLQAEMQSQVEAMRRQVQEQAEAARKIAAIAAWWLFSIAFTSGMTAAIAGILAVSGFEGLSPLFHLPAVPINFPLPHP